MLICFWFETEALKLKIKVYLMFKYMFVIVTNGGVINSFCRFKHLTKEMGQKILLLSQTILFTGRADSNRTCGFGRLYAGQSYTL